MAVSSFPPIIVLFYFACVFVFVFETVFSIYFPHAMCLIFKSHLKITQSQLTDALDLIALLGLLDYLDYLDSLEIQKKSFTHSVSDNLKSRDASASKNDLRTSVACTM